MLTVRTHKIALDPNTGQRKLLSQHAGYSRVAWNWGLAHFKRGLANGIWWHFRSVKRDWNAVKRELYPWAGAHSQNAAKYAFHDLGAAIDAWCDPERKNMRFPRFKRRTGCASFRADNGPDTVSTHGKRCTFPTLGSLRMREALRFDGPIVECTVKREAGRWFACFAVRVADVLEALPERPTIGVDVGVKELMTDSHGERYPNPRALAGRLRALRRVDKSIARSRKAHPNTCPKRREQAYAQRRRLHWAVRCVRDDAQHKAATRIVAKAGTGGVALETLNIAGMVYNRRLARALSDAAMGEMQRKIEYRCAWRGVPVHRVSQWLPSSKTCSGCGQRHEMPLSVRTMRCDCGLVLDRDWNAAINIAVAARSAETQNGRGAGTPVRTRREASTQAVLTGLPRLRRVGEIT